MNFYRVSYQQNKHFINILGRMAGKKDAYLVLLTYICKINTQLSHVLEIKEIKEDSRLQRREIEDDTKGKLKIES